MGNVPPEKIITSPGTGDGKPPATEPNMSQSDSAPGQCIPRRYRKRTMTYSLEPFPWGTYPLMRWFDVIDVTNSKYAQSGYSGHPSTSVYLAPGRYGPPSPLNMSNMVYSLPNHQSPSSPFEGQHLVHQYPPAHPQGLGYPVQSMGHYAGPNSAGSGSYAVPFAPGYAPYSMQHPGTVQHVPGHYPQYMGNPSMPNMGPGQPPTYGPGYYHQGYIPSSRHGSQSGPVQMQHSGSQSRQGSLSQGHSVLNQGSTNKVTDKRVSKEEYDVSKTIVDGSNPMKLAQLSSIPHGMCESMYSRILMGLPDHESLLLSNPLADVSYF
jgi:hypothetical protein